jgi:glycosyltransferase involved in cell wall biosynthesis
MAHPDSDKILESMTGVTVSRDEPRVGKLAAEWRTIFRSVWRQIPFLVLTADSRHGAAVSVASLFAGSSPKRASFYFHKTPSGFRDKFFNLLAARARCHAMALAPTEIIAESLRRAGWRHVEYVPYPALSLPESPLPVPFRQVMIAGVARLNKGLDLIVSLVKQWRSEGRYIPFFIQISKKHALRHGHRENPLVKELVASAYDGLIVDEKAPDRDEYVKRFRGSLVLAPYERERFTEAVSGIVLDALLHGTPVIATRGTWAGRQVERFSAGITIGERTSRALAAAIDAVLSDWPLYSKCACEAARKLAYEHDPRNLIAVVCQGER